MVPILSAVGVALAGLGAADPPANPDVKAELLAADRAFAKAAADNGLDGYMGFMAEDAGRLTKLGGAVVAGPAAVRRLDAAVFADPARRLVWDPTDAHPLADGRHGVTTGRSYFRVKRPDGTEEKAHPGAYVTMWRKGADGRWLVVFDTGAQDPPPAPGKKP